MMRLLIALIALLIPAEAGAQARIALNSEIFVERETGGVGSSRVVLQPVETVTPGDRLIYILEYRNVSGRTVSEFTVTNPLPPAVRFDKTLDGDEMVSVDNGKSWGKLRELTVALPGGKRRPALPSDVTHLRWQVPQRLAHGEAGRVTFRAIVR